MTDKSKDVEKPVEYRESLGDEADIVASLAFSNADKIDVKLDKRSAVSHKGMIAVTLVEKWGMIAAVEDGEDSAGRTKLRLSTPVEVVNRAMETADILVEQMKQVGWIVKTPTSTEMRAKFLEARGDDE